MTYDARCYYVSIPSEAFVFVAHIKRFFSIAHGLTATTQVVKTTSIKNENIEVLCRKNAI